VPIFTMRYIWDEEYPHKYTYPKHEHVFYEMAYYPIGTGLLNADGKDYPLGDGYYAIVPPNMSHYETQHLESRKICIGFYCNEKLPFIYQKDYSKKIHRIINEMFKEKGNLTYNSWDLLAFKLGEMFIYIDRDKQGNKKSAISKTIGPIIFEMENNFNKRISLKKYAEQLNVSYDHFRHKFKEITGESPQEYITNKRLEAASNLLSSTALSCSEIAENCGFSNSAQFSKMFKEKYNISPRQYRKN